MAGVGNALPSAPTLSALRVSIVMRRTFGLAPGAREHVEKRSKRGITSAQKEKRKPREREQVISTLSRNLTQVKRGCGACQYEVVR
jgi:hypothetical protein